MTNSARPTAIQEFDCVTLQVAAEAMGHRYEPGTMGTVVDIHPCGEFFEVELFEPEPGVVTLRRTDVTLVPTQTKGPAIRRA